MTKKTQKKLRKALLLINCAALLVCITVGVTVAYLTDKAEVKNVFTVGKVDIVLKETPVDANGKKTSAEPVEKGNEYTSLKPAQVVDKDPTVTVIGGSEACYVRAIVTLTKGDAIYALPSDIKIADSFNINKDYWDFKTETYNPEGDGTYTYEFWYKNEVAKSDTDTKLPALFTTVTVPSALTNKELATLNGMEINVEAHAIQSAGFETAENPVEAAWAAFKAE